MSLNYDFQIARADEAAAEAEIASLINIKQRALRSETAWRQIAALTLKTDLAREAARITREGHANQSQHICGPIPI